jgi:hypothetical protein
MCKYEFHVTLHRLSRLLKNKTNIEPDLTDTSIGSHASRIYCYFIYLLQYAPFCSWNNSIYQKLVDNYFYALEQTVSLLAKDK